MLFYALIIKNTEKKETNEDKVTRVMRVEARWLFLPNLSNAVLTFRLAFAERILSQFGQVK